MSERVILRACTKCGGVGSNDDFYSDKTKKDGFHTICKECVKSDRKSRYAEDPEKYLARGKAYYSENKDRFLGYGKKLRDDALSAYGNKCACCMEETREFLGIDHVNNDGEKHRRELKGYGRSIYSWLKRQNYPQDGRFQVLCHNCNMAKGLYGLCPHQGTPPGRRAKYQEIVETR